MLTKIDFIYLAMLKFLRFFHEKSKQTIAQESKLCQINQTE